MKVIVKDLRTKSYLAADGRWVTSTAEAKDFLTLLRAYHYAKGNTSGGFEVLLFCPEDDYSASIVTGIGIAESTAPAESEPIKIHTHPAPARFSGQSCRRRFLSTFGESRNYLN